MRPAARRGGLAAPPAIQRMCAECEEEEQIQRQCAECEADEETVQRQEEEEEEMIQSKRAAGRRTPAVTPAVAADLARLRRRGGRPLTASTRAFFEPRFGNDFSAVRVLSGDEAGKLSKKLNARAFAVGNDVFFGRGEYRPETSSGLGLLAHELTHAVQQTGGRSLPEPASSDPVASRPGIPGTPETVRARIDRVHRFPGASGGAEGGAVQRTPAEPEPDGENPKPAELDRGPGGARVRPDPRPGRPASRCLRRPRLGSGERPLFLGSQKCP